MREIQIDFVILTVVHDHDECSAETLHQAVALIAYSACVSRLKRPSDSYTLNVNNGVNGVNNSHPYTIFGVRANTPKSRL